MKFGCCLNMLADKHDKVGIEKMQTLGSLGYDYAELPLAEICALSRNDYLRLKDILTKSGIPCWCCNNFFPSTIRLTGPSLDLALIAAYTQRALDIAADLGAHTIVFGSGGAKNIPHGFAYEAAYAQIVTMLQNINDLAATRDIMICIEPLRQAECNLINTFQEGCRLASDVACTNIKVLVDLFHMVKEGEEISHLTRHGRDYLRHVHIAMPTSRRFPRDGSPSDNIFNEFFNELRALNYSEQISCEAYSDDFSADAEAALKFLKRNFLQ